MVTHKTTFSGVLPLVLQTWCAQTLLKFRINMTNCILIWILIWYYKYYKYYVLNTFHNLIKMYIVLCLTFSSTNYTLLITTLLKHINKNNPTLMAIDWYKSVPALSNAVPKDTSAWKGVGLWFIVVRATSLLVQRFLR